MKTINNGITRISLLPNAYLATAATTFTLAIIFASTTPHYQPLQLATPLQQLSQHQH
jgi:hypothetical protein